MKLYLPEQVEYIISELEKAGYRADTVGGSVRDLLLGKSPYDYDITTSATPDKTKAVFSHMRTVDTGIKHGTVSLIIDSQAYEITTYRVDGEYKDSRHPEEVFFTQRIEEDLARRDFTVNAIAYSPSHGITDPFGGRQDIADKVIRAVGDPYLRFDEDALRILRGVRFSATLGFNIEENTSAAIREKKHLLKNVSAERIYVEIKKMLHGDYAHGVISDYGDVVSTVVPALSEIILPDKDRFASADYLSRLLAIFYLSCDNAAASFEESCYGLKTDSHTREVGACALSSVGDYDLTTDLGLKQLLRDKDVERAEALIRLEILLGRAENISLHRLNELVQSGVCYRYSDLAVNGKDIMSLGISGREVGAMLDALLSAVIEGRVDNSRDALISYARKTKN